MKSIWEQILVRTTSSLIVSSIISLLSIIVIIWLSIKDPLSQLIYNNVPKTILLLLPLVLFLLLSLSIVYIIYLRKKIKKNLFSAFGVYWDKDLNVYCPSCKTMLSNYAFYESGRKHHPGFKCIKCNSVVRLSDDEHIFMKYDEAKERIKNNIKKYS